ncbi:hypothetical protein T09_11638 [Trichinella sp. T9]|nr:hypothetical protein T09_11638 [Trichinella sp. T9]
MLAWLQQRNSLKGVCSHLSRMTPTEKNALSIRATHYPCCSETNTVLIQFCWLLKVVYNVMCAAAGEENVILSMRFLRLYLFLALNIINNLFTRIRSNMTLGNIACQLEPLGSWLTICSLLK